MNILSLIVGALLCLDAVLMGIMANYNAGVILTLLISLCMLAYGFFKNKIVAASKTGILKLVRYIYYAGMTILVALIAFISIYGNFDNVTYKEDAVIVLGAGLRGDKITAPLYYRLKTATEYYEKNNKALIVVSGGMGPGETVTEASAMKNYLVSNGVPESAVIMEEKATSTYENLMLSKEILEDKIGKNFKAAVITNGFHIYRADRLAKYCGIDATHLHGGINWYTIPVNYIRECAAVVKTWIIGY